MVLWVFFVYGKVTLSDSNCAVVSSCDWSLDHVQQFDPHFSSGQNSCDHMVIVGGKWVSEGRWLNVSWPDLRPADSFIFVRLVSGFSKQRRDRGRHAIQWRRQRAESVEPAVWIRIPSEGKWGHTRTSSSHTDEFILLTVSMSCRGGREGRAQITPLGLD